MLATGGGVRELIRRVSFFFLRAKQIIELGTFLTPKHCTMKQTISLLALLVSLLISTRAAKATVNDTIKARISVGFGTPMIISSTNDSVFTITTTNNASDTSASF
jgi:hypothetical protein